MKYNLNQAMKYPSSLKYQINGIQTFPSAEKSQRNEIGDDRIWIIPFGGKIGQNFRTQETGIETKGGR